MKKCSICKTVKPLSDFGKDKNRKDGHQYRCRVCDWPARRDSVNRTKDDNARKIYEYLLNHPCVDCGETDPIVLEFDHQRDKLKGVGYLSARGHKWDRILAEIEKCEVRCANCHKRRTAKQFNYRRAVLVKGL